MELPESITVDTHTYGKLIIGTASCITKWIIRWIHISQVFIRIFQKLSFWLNKARVMLWHQFKISNSKAWHLKRLFWLTCLLSHCLWLFELRHEPQADSHVSGSLGHIQVETPDLLDLCKSSMHYSTCTVPVWDSKTKYWNLTLRSSDTKHWTTTIQQQHENKL